MKKIANLRSAAVKGLEYLLTVNDVKEAEVFVAVNDRFVARLNYTSAISCNGVQELKSDYSSGVSVRAVFETKEGAKIGFGSEDKQTSLNAVKRALIKARKVAVADPHFKSLPRPIGSVPTLKNYHDPEIMKGNDGLLAGQAWRVLEGALKTFQEAGFTERDSLSVTGDITVLREQIAIASTHGIVDCDQSTILMAAITAMIEEKNSKGTGWATGTHFTQFDAEEAGRMAARSAIDTIGGQRIRSGKYSVIFGHQPVCALFTNLVIPCLSLSSAMLNTSPFKEKLDQLIMAEDISIYDDGSLPGRMASKRITCEGIPTGRTQLVDRGRLVGLLANSYFANWAGDSRFVPRNGFRFGGGGRWHRSEPGISATNLVIESANPVSEEKLCKKVGNGVFIGRLWYLYPINGSGSGDFTGTVVGDSYLIKDGKIANPLQPNTVRINGNWLELMKGNILGVSGEQKATLDWAIEEIVLAPQIAFADVELEEIDVLLA